MILANRGGDLAHADRQDVADALSARFPDELALHLAEVEDPTEGVVRGTADVAVHRIEHLPMKLPEELVLAAVLPRRWPTDSLVSDLPLRSLPKGARVATSNVRRRAMLLRARPDLRVIETHADARTRLQSWRVGEWDGLVLSTASVKRLSLDVPCEEIDSNLFVPSPGQGAIGCICQRGSRFQAFCEGIDDRRTRTEVEVERAILQSLGGWIGAPVGVHAAMRGDALAVHAIVLSLDGRRAVAHKEDLSTKDPLYESDEFAERLRRMGGDVLLGQARRALG